MFDFELQDIKTLILDLDGTLLDLSFDNYFWLEHIPNVYAKKNNISRQQAKVKLNNLYQKYSGTLSWYCLDFWQNNINLNIRSLKKNCQDKIRIRDGILPFLKTIKKQNITVILATNAHPFSLEIKMNKTKLDMYFDHKQSSHLFGSPKEEIVFWQKLHKKYNFNLANTLFIDDNENILNTAYQFGIKYNIGVSTPDSTQPAIKFANFQALANLCTIL
jgi:5'-nucleotidase